MRLRGLIFDLDGTLVDSSPDLAFAVNATRQRLGLEALPLPAVVAMVGEGARTLVRRALPPEVDGEDFEAALRLFLAIYLDHCLDATRAYPGIAELLPALAARLPVGVLTNKPELPSRRILDGLGLLRWCDPLIGGDTLPARKPDPAGVHAIARRWGVRTDEVLLIGDSRVDAETAAAAGCGLALVTWGYGRRDELTRHDAWLVERVDQLSVLGDGELPP